jgi:hypothetical protein
MRNTWALLAAAIAVAGCRKGPMTSTFLCGGNETRTFTGRAFTVSGGTAIIAGGNCELTLNDCAVSAATGISAGGNAKIVLNGGTLNGAVNSLSLGGNANVDVRGTRVSGPVSKGGNAVLTGLVGAPSPK